MLYTSDFYCAVCQSHLNKTERKIKDLYVKPETIKCLEENRCKLLYIILGNDFLDLTPKAKATKANKTNKHKNQVTLPQSFCTAKETINKMKRQSMEWGKIFANHVSDKGLISKIHSELIQLNSL